MSLDIRNGSTSQEKGMSSVTNIVEGSGVSVDHSLDIISCSYLNRLCIS